MFYIWMEPDLLFLVFIIGWSKLYCCSFAFKFSQNSNWNFTIFIWLACFLAERKKPKILRKFKATYRKPEPSQHIWVIAWTSRLVFLTWLFMIQTFTPATRRLWRAKAVLPEGCFCDRTSHSDKWYMHSRMNIHESLEGVFNWENSLFKVNKSVRQKEHDVLAETAFMNNELWIMNYE